MRRREGGDGGRPGAIEGVAVAGQTTWHRYYYNTLYE